MGHYRDVLKEISGPSAELKQMLPDTYAGFSQMYGEAFADGALSKVAKELMAVAIAIHDGCDGCIASHTRSAARAGATPEQMAETISVAILMGGGPATIYGPRAWESFKEFASP